MIILTEKQMSFFETFGFLKFPQLLKDDITWITQEFEQVFPMFQETTKHDGTKRTLVVPFIDQRQKLSALLDDSRIDGILVSLLGKQYNYMGSDGNYYSGNTDWHPDGDHSKYKHLKIAIYLDELDENTGALQVIPGSHKKGPFRDELLEMIRFPTKSMHIWGIQGNEIPAVVLDTKPGDVLVFNHNLFHSSWNGSKKRRMFTINVGERFKEEHLAELVDSIRSHATFHREHYYGPEMLNNINPLRMTHLEQVISVSDNMSELSNHLPSLFRV